MDGQVAANAAGFCPRCGEGTHDDGAYCPHCGRHTGPLKVSWVQRAYWKVFLVGLLLNYVAMKLLTTSGNPNLVPTVMVLGAFLVPVTFVVFLYENEALSNVTPSVIALTFSFGGVLGTMAAQLLEERLVLSMDLLGMLAGLLREGNRRQPT